MPRAKRFTKAELSELGRGLAAGDPAAVAEMAKLGGHSRAKKLGKEGLARAMKKASEARWGPYRARKAAAATEAAVA